jgi:hypothetical protein
VFVSFGAAKVSAVFPIHQAFLNLFYYFIFKLPFLTSFDPLQLSLAHFWVKLKYRKFFELQLPGVVCGEMQPSTLSAVRGRAGNQVSNGNQVAQFHQLGRNGAGAV